jgi:hypothetical protein
MCHGEREIMTDFHPIRETMLLVVAWLVFIISILSAAKWPPARLSDANVPTTAGSKATLIREYDNTATMSDLQIFKLERRNYWKREVLCIVLAIVFGMFTYKKGYLISEETGRMATWGGILALLLGPFYFAIHLRPRK